MTVLSAHLSQVADELSSMSKDLSSKTTSLESTVTVIETWKSSQHDQQHNAGFGGSGGVYDGASSAVMGSVMDLGSQHHLPTNAMQSIIDHLSQANE
jgi:hypothetical protein